MAHDKSHLTFLVSLKLITQTAFIYTQQALHEITLSGLVVEASSLPMFCPAGPVIEQLGC